MTTLAELVARSAQLLNEGVAARAKNLRLSPTEGRVLVALASRDGEPMSELGHCAMVKQATLSKAIVCLERKRFVERAWSAKDRRCCLVLLSKRGRLAADQLLLHLHRHQAVLYDCLGVADVRNLETALSHLNEMLVDIAGREETHRPDRLIPARKSL